MKNVYVSRYLGLPSLVVVCQQRRLGGNGCYALGRWEAPPPVYKQPIGAPQHLRPGDLL